MIRIGLDIDELLSDFMGAYLQKFGKPSCDYEITKNVQNLKNDKGFWESLPKLRSIDFTPTLYCTKRINPKQYTKNWLKENNIPLAPVYQMYYQKGDKSRMIKGRVDIFVDDSPSNFIQINKAGIPCLLMDSPYNQDFKTDLRITDLTYQNILNKYNEFFRKL